MRSISQSGWQRERRDDLPLSEIVHVLWGRRLLVVGVVLLLVVLALLFGLFRGPDYTAEATINMRPQERLINDDERQAFVEEVRSTVVTQAWLREVMRRADWQGEAKGFKDRLDIEAVPHGENIGLQVRFSGTGPDEAVRAANAYAELFVQKAENINGGRLVADAVIERSAALPASGLRLLLLYALAAVAAGVLAGGIGALLLEGRTRSWRDARDAELTLRAPVLGVIPDYSSLKEGD